ncbi:MAG: hypothetical protein A3G87_08260 [Omnitrophica bacterium RIFCSPLOWO2_12_FULL_50_11]|nr:MAG: hypothetical protein A3G87_08260 [Omnitrophica bacterium RIFCSPLOWO2_12_FULL_50_11]
MPVPKVRGCRGFTILEVLIAAFLVSIGMFALVEAMNRGIFGVGEVEDYTLALALAQAKMEEIKDTAYSSVSGSARADINGYPEFEQAVTVTTPQTDLKQIVVTSYWDTPSGEMSVSLTTYVVNS